MSKESMGKEIVKSNLKCEDCGVESENVSEVNCPFAKEIYGAVNKVTICYNCFFERSQDI